MKSFYKIRPVKNTKLCLSINPIVTSPLRLCLCHDLKSDLAMWGIVDGEFRNRMFPNYSINKLGHKSRIAVGLSITKNNKFTIEKYYHSWGSGMPLPTRGLTCKIKMRDLTLFDDLTMRPDISHDSSTLWVLEYNDIGNVFFLKDRPVVV